MLPALGFWGDEVMEVTYLACMVPGTKHFCFKINEAVLDRVLWRMSE